MTQITSKDGNMVVDFYPVKDWDNTLFPDYKLKVLTFRGCTQKKMLITKSEYDYQIDSYVNKHKYQVTDNLNNLPQFHNFKRLSYV